MLDLSTALMGGFLFVVIVRLFESGAHERSFDLYSDVFKTGRFGTWYFGGDNFDNFFFGFIITYLIILIYNQYKKN